MEQPIESYRNVAASPVFLEMIRQRERAQHNAASALANAYLKGIADALKGRLTGVSSRKERQEIRQRFAKMLNEDGFNVKQIARTIKISEQKVTDLLGKSIIYR